VLKTVIFLV